jgi:hypothetical protein
MFVDNRVSQIQELATACEWRHAASTSNPADFISQGTTLETLKNCKLWWLSPEWLSQHQRQWPNTPLLRHPEPALEQRKVTPVNVVIQCTLAEFITRISTLSRLQTVAAYCLRFVHNAHSPSSRTGYLTSTELRDALHAYIKIAQQIMLKKLMTSAKRVKFHQKTNLCTHFLTRKVIFELVEDYSIHIFRMIPSIN